MQTSAKSTDGNSLDGKMQSPSSGYNLTLDESGQVVKINKGGEATIEDVRYIALELAVQKVYNAFNMTEDNVPTELK